DHRLLSKLTPSKDTIYVFDKGYNDYKAFKWFTEQNAGFVTRIKDNAAYTIQEELFIDDCIHSGVLEDVMIEVLVNENGAKTRLTHIAHFYRKTNFSRTFSYIFSSQQSA